MNVKKVILGKEKAQRIKGWEIGLLVLLFAVGLAIGLVVF